MPVVVLGAQGFAHVGVADAQGEGREDEDDDDDEEAEGMPVVVLGPVLDAECHDGQVG